MTNVGLVAPGPATLEMSVTQYQLPHGWAPGRVWLGMSFSAADVNESGMVTNKDRDRKGRDNADQYESSHGILSFSGLHRRTQPHLRSIQRRRT
jgi:hypothetical protein